MRCNEKYGSNLIAKTVEPPEKASPKKQVEFIKNNVAEVKAVMELTQLQKLLSYVYEKEGWRSDI